MLLVCTHTLCHSHTHCHTHTHSVTHTQNDEGKLEDLLKEVAETEVPPDAPQPPPDQPDEEDGNGDDEMLPSQRGKAGGSGLSHYTAGNCIFIICTCYVLGL